MARWVCIALLCAAPAMAEDWQALTGERIRTALAARTVRYTDGAVQTFFADGRTLYEAPGASWGRWRLDGDRYCSVWPPADRWACYGLEINGLDIRFTADDGDQAVGRYIDLQ